MSIKVMSSVWDSSEQSGSALLLLLALADFADEDGYCWPTTETLAQKIRMSMRTVLRMVEQLESAGELYVIHSRRNNRYIVRVGRNDDHIRRVLVAHDYPIPDNLSYDKVTYDNLSPDMCQTVTSHVTQPCHPNRQEPLHNRQEESPTGDLPGDDSELTDEPPPRDYLTDLAAYHKRTKGKPSWTIPAAAGGADPYLDGPLVAACAILRITPESLTEKEQRSYASVIRTITEGVKDGTPELFIQACQMWASHGPTWKGKTGPPYANVRGDGFRDDMQMLMRQIISGTIEKANGWSKDY